MESVQAGSGWSAIVQEQADPDRPVFVTAQETWSWSTLLGRAGGAAAVLDDLGIPAGTPVPGLIDHVGLSLALTLGGASTGHPYAPFGTRLTTSELSAMLRRLGSPVLLTDAAHAEHAAQVAAAAGCRSVTLPDLPLTAPPPPPGPDAVTAILHTSGTTGLPKQVAFTERTLEARLHCLEGVVTLGPGDTYLVASSVHHVAGFGNAVLTIGRGGTVASFPRFSVDAWKELRDKNITHTLIVPTMINDLLRAGALDIHPKLRVLSYGAAPMRPDLLRTVMETLPNVSLLQLFGQTEGTPITGLTPTDHQRARDGRSDLLRSVGRPVPGVEIRLADVSPEGIGEVYARGPHLCGIGADGWLHTGDLGHLDGEGYLFLDGRAGDTINRGGENVRPQEVEEVLRAHPVVAEVAVAGVPDDRLGETVAAFVVPKDPGATPDWEALREFARAQLAGFKVPAVWHVVDELPRNPSGKVLRRVLAQEFAQA